MSYNKFNYYTRIIEIQNIVLEQQKKGVYNEWTYNNIIKKRFIISRSTFYNYLGINAKAEIKKLKQYDTQTKNTNNFF